ncbi:hypothetical protein HanRHA438_Chr12g0567961 [Helianthus annuus]|nr:hypothetical protein HanIR_Chr12g0600761 [Helianthus annuus]KAJ0867856.1 hypothetical protein HanRHA438_Chr12g0567961 [Helianthus annuus]
MMIDIDAGHINITTFSSRYGNGSSGIHGEAPTEYGLGNKELVNSRFLKHNYGFWNNVKMDNQL